ncbi:MAG TPA: Gfo/Idh/MocA family oxidoreductase [Chloroflexota bacterium]|nr:Gfo/Idh/MocA family oxidoreductase [Chloroflexota bacterium]
MSEDERIAVGIVGTSWWADAMYLPALATHPHARLAAVCGRDEQKARLIAARWNIPGVYAGYREMIERGGLDAVIVASANNTHYDITMAAVDEGLHVLCEKPLALTYDQARRMAEAADRQGIKHMVPFTYSYMPVMRYLKELVDGGYIGRPYHLNMRYYTGYGRNGAYLWRFDVGKAGSGAVGDIGSHFLYLARHFFGDVSAVTCRLGHAVSRPSLDPHGQPYEPADDMAALLLEFDSGAQGVIHVSTVAYEDTHFGQTHHVELHGSGGTLHGLCDWDTVQRVEGARQGEGPAHPLPIPGHIWNGARRDTVHNTYRDIFRTQNVMAREFISAIAENKPLRPNFHDGAYVQKLVECALLSHREGRRVAVGELP